VAALPWNQWQLSRGMGGRLRLESVATLVWNTQTTSSIYPSQDHTQPKNATLRQIKASVFLMA
ncbi:hypothetical protein, partial [Marinobacter persicus]|uniref:hypothetical protein n=1 Tax=Marinobacter persicus TaxID=930118 RepID=UPI001CA48554